MKNPSRPLASEGASFNHSLAARPIPSSFFTFSRSPSGVRALGEMSEIQKAGHRLIQPLYNDAADAGFVLRSEKTGELIVFVFQEEEKDGEGEFTGWRFGVSAASARRVPAMAGATLLAVND